MGAEDEATKVSKTAGTGTEDAKLVDVDLKKEKPEEITKTNLIGVWLVIASVCIDVLGSSIVQPVLPFYAQQFGADGKKLGYLYTGFTAMSILSTYAMSVASDKVGRRVCILFSIMGSLTYFIWMGFVDSYGMLLAARIYGGCTSGSFTVAQAYIVDAVPEHQQSQYFVYLSGTLIAMYMIGPLLGGALVAAGDNAGFALKDQLRVPYYFSAILACCTFIFAFSKLENTKSKDEEADDGIAISPADREFEEKVKEPHPDSEKVPGVVYLIGGIGMLHGAGFSVFGSMGTLFLLEKYGMQTIDISLLVLASAFVYAVSLIVLYARLKSKIGEYYSAATGSFFVASGCLVIGLLGESDVAKWFTFVSLCCLFFLGNGFFSPAFPSINSHFAGEHNRGKVLATGNSMREIAGVWGPIVFGALYDVDPHTPWIVAGVITFIAVIPMAYLGYQHVPKQDKEALKKKLDDITHDEEGNIVAWNNAPAFTSEKFDENDDLYMMLGRDVGKILIDKRYPWIYKNSYPYILKTIDNSLITFPKWLLADKDQVFWPDFRAFWQSEQAERAKQFRQDIEERLQTQVYNTHAFQIANDTHRL